VISIWLFVALAVACVAMHLIQHGPQATHTTDGEHMVDGHDVKPADHKRGHGCCH
jgi:hypothetical protein